MPVPVGLSLAAQHNRNHLRVGVWLCVCMWAWAFIALSIRCWPVPASNNHPRFYHYERSSFGICYVHTHTDTHTIKQRHTKRVSEDQWPASASQSDWPFRGGWPAPNKTPNKLSTQLEQPIKLIIIAMIRSSRRGWFKMVSFPLRCSPALLVNVSFPILAASVSDRQ